VALEDAALIPELRAVLDEDLGGGSLHRMLEERGVVATRATGTITARLARASETELLDLAPQAALLVELRVLFDQHGRVFERTETRYAADRYVIDVVHTHP
jgi:GntR family transcriptional regulator